MIQLIERGRAPHQRTDFRLLPQGIGKEKNLKRWSQCKARRRSIGDKNEQFR